MRSWAASGFFGNFRVPVFPEGGRERMTGWRRRWIGGFGGFGGFGGSVDRWIGGSVDRWIGESGNRGIGESGNRGIGESGNRAGRAGRGSVRRGHGGCAGFFRFHLGEIPDPGNSARLGRVISPGDPALVGKGRKPAGKRSGKWFQVAGTGSDFPWREPFHLDSEKGTTKGTNLTSLTKLQ
jgi:hypothetical protein